MSTYLFGAVITASLLYIGRFLHRYSHLIRPSLLFIFANFIHPIGGKGLKQSDHLENFYKLQVYWPFFPNLL